MREIATPAAMQAWADATRTAGRRIGLVPTMGYLHDGHLSLVAEARRRADTCVASIFVNPMQFGPREDLAAYPRDLARDRAALAGAGVDVLYLPTAEVMYPAGFQTEVAVTKMTAGLCGRSRPGHFRGVTTVVTKLFNAVRPHVAVFGEKDYQQLAVLRRMAADLDMGVEVVGMPIVREADGLAMSSRNAYLAADERVAARCLSRALAAARTAYLGGARRAADVLAAATTVLAAEPLARVDYAELVDADSLEPTDALERPALLALAVFVGRTRLIDNAVLTASPA
ncbi:MAG: pantoate--beta-alanine ligase [Deltaproteobacteria bacterium]|nr:pantoate--beta-alanine ligase [Deltaproteobacteria bacterium]